MCKTDNTTPVQDDNDNIRPFYKMIIEGAAMLDEETIAILKEDV